MATLRQYKKKIKSARGIAKITKALQMVSASKTKKAQELAHAGIPYVTAMHGLTPYFGGHIDAESHPLFITPDSQKELVVLVGPEKGLCGNLIGSLGSKVSSILTKDKSQYEFIAVGKKAEYIVLKKHLAIIAEFNLGTVKPTYDMILPIVRLITEKFTTDKVGRVSLLYSHFNSATNYEPTYKVLLPVTAESLKEEDVVESTVLFEPSAEEIARYFFDRYIEIEIYQALLESYASEHGARMVAMKNANDNAKGLINYLSLEYNKARQSAITSEIADISASALAA